MSFSGCPRCNKQMCETSSYKFKCDSCNIVVEYYKEYSEVLKNSIPHDLINSCDYGWMIIRVIK